MAKYNKPLIELYQNVNVGTFEVVKVPKLTFNRTILECKSISTSNSCIVILIL